MQLGISAAWMCEWPSSCCRPSPFSVVRPEVPPSRKPRALVAGRPGEVAEALEAEHRVVDEERDHLHAVRAVGGRRGYPGSHGAGFGDAFLQDLAVFDSL
jgi:hypothetical protein